MNIDVSNMFDCVIYHEYCPDGICAAWIVKHHTDKYNNKIDVIPCKAGCEPDKNLKYFTNKKIVFVDICPPTEYILKMADIADYIYIIDHHKTSYEKFLELNNIPTKTL